MAKSKSNSVILFLFLICCSFSLKIQHAQAWESYIVNMIAQSKKAMDQGSIISLDGGAPWVSSSPIDLKITPLEGSVIARAFKTKDFSGLQANGCVVEGTKYQFLREDGKVAFCKLKNKGALTMQQSKSAVVIGHTIEGQQQGNTNKAVGIIADYLESVGM